MRQVPQHVVEDVARDIGVLRVAGDLVRLQIRNRELRLVVQHLFEVRHEPVFVHRVAVKSAAELIVHPALGHRAQRRQHHVPSFFIAGGGAIAQQKIGMLGRGNLGAPPNPPSRESKDLRKA